ncbi:UNVERIFIED_CONTAM: hypothetical protein K2H54_031186 [Gekko kuhli]
MGSVGNGMVSHSERPYKNAEKMTGFTPDRHVLTGAKSETDVGKKTSNPMSSLFSCSCDVQVLPETTCASQAGTNKYRSNNSPFTDKGEQTDEGHKEQRQYGAKVHLNGFGKHISEQMV